MSSDGEQVVITAGALRRIVRNAATGAVKALVPKVVRDLGGQGRALLNNPVKFVLTTVILWFLNAFVYPVFNAVLAAGRAIINAITTALFTIANIANLTSSTIIGGLAVVPSQVFGYIESFNQALAMLAASAGLGAPVIVTALYIIEVAVALYLVWAVIEALQLGPYLEIVAKPLRGVLSFIS